MAQRHVKDGTASRIFGDMTDIKGTEVDTYWLLQKNAKAARKPRLYVSCGTKDFLYGAHEKFVPALIENGWDVTRHDEPDAVHEWGFWDQEIKKFIEFMYSAKD